MATLVSTAGASNQNTYCSLAKATSYHETVSTADEAAWNELSDDQKTRALIMATRYLDQQVRFKGTPTTITQPLAWPRKNVPLGGNRASTSDLIADNVVPNWLQEATAELARIRFGAEILEDAPSEATNLLDQVGELNLGPIKLKFDQKAVDQLPNKVWLMVRDYCVQDTGSDDLSGFGSIPLGRS